MVSRTTGTEACGYDEAARTGAEAAFRVKEVYFDSTAPFFPSLHEQPSDSISLAVVTEGANPSLR